MTPAPQNAPVLLSLALLLLLPWASVQAATYTVTLVEHDATPILSSANDVGKGHSPCKDTFNPSFIPASPGLNASGLLVRLNGCPSGTTGGTGEHIGFAPCTADGVCGDLDPNFALEAGSQDPRALLDPTTSFYYNFYFANYDAHNPDHCTGGSGLCTVKLARTKTPLDAASWQHITTLPWHRNGCCILRKSGPHYCIFGEGSGANLAKEYPTAGPYPMPGLGIATTPDLAGGVFTPVNWTGLIAQNMTQGQSLWFDALGPAYNEVKLEAGAHPVELSDGSYLFFYAAATPGWVDHGNYTVGWVILDKDDPSHVVQRQPNFMLPTFDYETLCHGSSDCKYSGERKNVIFMSSAIPTGNKDEFRLFFGAGDGNVGRALVQVHVSE